MPPTPLLHRGIPVPRRSAPTSSHAEELTRAALRAARRRRALPGWVPHVLTGSGPAFDLLLTNAGPVALTSVRCDGVLDADRVERIAYAARDAARGAESLLGAAGCFETAAAVVAVWGGDAYAVPSGGGEQHGVLFLRGREVRPWLRQERARADVVWPEESRDLALRLTLLPSC